MRLIFILMLFANSFFKVSAQECSVVNNSFSVGERIEYTIYYYLAGVWVSAGDVYFKVDTLRISDQLYYHFDSYGKTFKKYDWVYKVRDHYQAYTNVKTFKPLRFKREVNEGSTYIREDYVFNQRTNKIVTLRQIDKEKPMVKDTVDWATCSFDVLTMIYYARNLDFSNLSIGDQVPCRIFIDNESHDSYIRYLGIEELTIKGQGTFRCIVFSPLLIYGSIFSPGEDMTVWVTDDENRVPLLIETPIIVGSIKARINKMDGLRHPLKSKIAD